MKKIRNIILIIVGVCLLLTVFFGIKRGFWGIGDKFKYANYKEGRDYYLQKIDYEAENERILKSQPSEIEGMTRYDKVQAGLSPYLIDTDGDKLSDADELSIGSDPTKASTSGDMYPDGYKLLHDMDLYTYYDFDADSVQFDGITANGVSVNIARAEDFNGTVKRVEVDERYKGVYEIFQIDGLQGNIIINLSDIMKEFNVTMDEIAIYSRGLWNQGDLEKCKYQIRGTNIIFDSGFGLTKKYIYIVNADAYNVDISDSYEGRIIVFGSPCLRAWGNGKFNIWYSESGDAIKDEIVLDHAKQEVSIVTDANMRGQNPVSEAYDNIEIKKVSEVDVRYKLLKYLLPLFECDKSENMKWYQLFYYYSDCTDGASQKAESYGNVGEMSIDHENDRFDFKKDTLSFRNFGSEISTGGNCAGIATLTARTFNGNFIPGSGEYNKYTWDISADRESDTLRDAFLYDYKDKNFVDNHLGKYTTAEGKEVEILNINIFQDERQFINMIGCYWAECNDVMRTHSDYVFLPANVKQSYKRIEAAKQYLDSNKILIAFFMNKDYGHAVNIVGYNELGGGLTQFYIYDSNFPGLKISMIVGARDDGTFDYEYTAPYNLYAFSSYEGGNMFMIADDNYNELVPCEWIQEDIIDINNQWHEIKRYREEKEEKERLEREELRRKEEEKNKSFIKKWFDF